MRQACFNVISFQAGNSIKEVEDLDLPALLPKNGLFADTGSLVDMRKIPASTVQWEGVG